MVGPQKAIGISLTLRVSENLVAANLKEWSSGLKQILDSILRAERIYMVEKSSRSKPTKVNPVNLANFLSPRIQLGQLGPRAQGRQRAS